MLNLKKWERNGNVYNLKRENNFNQAGNDFTFLILLLIFNLQTDFA